MPDIRDLVAQAWPMPDIRDLVARYPWLSCPSLTGARYPWLSSQAWPVYTTPCTRQVLVRELSIDDGSYIKMDKTSWTYVIRYKKERILNLYGNSYGKGKGLFIIHLDKVWQSNLISGSLFFMSVNHIMMSCFYFLLAWSILLLLLLDDYLFMQSTLEIIAY